MHSWLDLSRTNIKFLFKPNWINTLPLNFNLNREILQFSGTKSEIINVHNYTGYNITYCFTNLNKETEFDIVNFFCSRKGKLERFWIPLWKNIFTLYSDILINSNSINVYGSNFYLVDKGFERIFIHLKNGDYITRKIIASISHGIYETLFLASGIDRIITNDDINCFGRFLLVRFDQDDLNIEFVNNTCSTCELKFIELPFEYEVSSLS